MQRVLIAEKMENLCTYSEFEDYIEQPQDSDNRQGRENPILLYTQITVLKSKSLHAEGTIDCRGDMVVLQYQCDYSWSYHVVTITLY